MPQFALLVIDMLNPYDHEDADALARNVEPIIEPLSELVASAKDAGAEIVYVNDNYGDFTNTREQMVQVALDGRRPELVEPIVPADDMAFLQKVRHSAFYSTALDYLLGRKGIETVVLAGQVTEQCILYTALDAYVRHFDIRVAKDTVAAVDPDLGDAALRMMRRNMRVDVVDVVDACSV